MKKHFKSVRIERRNGSLCVFVYAYIFVCIWEKMILYLIFSQSVSLSHEILTFPIRLKNPNNCPKYL